ncbi:acid ceramidase-like [Lineus longissimus]|uniref:acid ceramidase-like n=1 Tax=Lineus longissimus TaxID=88925 RepID=UPI002B4CF21E
MAVFTPFVSSLAVFLTLFVIVSSQFPPYEEICVHDKYPPPAKDKVPTEVVNLDLPPIERWQNVMKDKGPAVQGLLKAFILFISDFFGEATTNEILRLVNIFVGALDDTLPPPFPDELRGIAKATGIPLGEVVLYNIFYEVFTVCTSVIAEDPHGRLHHARNLDFGLFLGWDQKTHAWNITTALRPAVVNLDWQRGGKTVFKSVNFAGYVGILTAMKPQLFTLTMNERFNIKGGYIGIINWILGDRKSRWMGFLTRLVMETAKGYEEAKELLSNEPMLAPAYFILGGNSSGQGCVITRSSAKAIDVWEMKRTGHPWFILETNYDHWEAPLFLDDRRTPANKCMANMTQANVGFPGIYNVLSSKPVLNKLTAYTALMQVNSGTFESYLRYCPDPCFPW